MANQIYERIIQLISEQRLSNQKVEHAAGLGNGTIASWKDGNPTISNLEKVCNVLGCTIQDLVGKE